MKHGHQHNGQDVQCWDPNNAKYTNGYSQGGWPDQSSNFAVGDVYRQAQTQFCDALVTKAKHLCQREMTISEIDFLRSVNVYNVTQLFYYFRAYGIVTK